MEQVHHYGTVTEAIADYRKRGFKIDFNLHENCLICNNKKRYDVDDFDIVEVYHYEGMSDPADSAMVYAIESKNGEKGILVTGYGTSVSGMSAAILRKLSFKDQSN